ncbi:MAG: hypothetical protein HQ546_01570, partial [Planctomycetes bacterium]|nr:hypothetical protein [Planctomycetota bacterium]
DGSLPVEQIVSAAQWCLTWQGTKLCVVVDPAEEQLLLGTESSGAGYLGNSELSDCDGFLVIGDVFSSNPVCARGVLERKAREPRTPLVVIDAGQGKTAKFATHTVDCPVGAELSALAALAASMGIDITQTVSGAPASSPSSQSAGKALTGCRKLGVLLAAGYGRTPAWRQVGFLAGQLAKSRGGGVAVQTVCANTLGSIRLTRALGLTPLVSALDEDPMRMVAIGCDVVGMLGWSGGKILAAAAALPSATTEAAEFVLPVALPMEIGGTVTGQGARAVMVSPLAPVPAGVPTPAELVGMLARCGGVSVPSPREISASSLAERLPHDHFAPVGVVPKPAAPAADQLILLFERQALHAGVGELTGHASWQAGVLERLELYLAEPDASRLGLTGGEAVTVRAGGQSVPAVARIRPGLTQGRAVISEGLAATRALAPSKVDEAQGLVYVEPPMIEVVRQAPQSGAE